MAGRVAFGSVRHASSKPVARWVLLVVALLALSGHLCALPVVGHAHPQESAAGGETSAHDTLHASSCEGIRVDRALPSPAGLTASVSLPESPARDIGMRVDPTPSSVPPAGPPRFLLHAALLI